MIVAFTDIETTGLEWAKGDKIVEIAVELWECEKQKTNTPSSGNPISIRKPLFSMERRVNPQRAMSAKAAQITGLTFADLAHEEPYGIIAPTIGAIFNKADLVVSHNGIAFDIPFIMHEQAIFGHPVSIRAQFDTMVAGRGATFNGKLPSLQELCFALDVEYDVQQAHGALYDVQVLRKCFFSGIDCGFFPSLC
jgi:DNA polymerase-3 subunit epsilon